MSSTSVGKKVEITARAMSPMKTRGAKTPMVFSKALILSGSNQPLVMADHAKTPINPTHKISPDAFSQGCHFVSLILKSRKKTQLVVHAIFCVFLKGYHQIGKKFLSKR